MKAMFAGTGAGTAVAAAALAVMLFSEPVLDPSDGVPYRILILGLMTIVAFVTWVAGLGFVWGPVWRLLDRRGATGFWPYCAAMLAIVAAAGAVACAWSVLQAGGWRREVTDLAVAWAVCGLGGVLIAAPTMWWIAYRPAERADPIV